MEFLTTENAPAAIGPYSQAVKFNGMLYTSGQIALELNGEMVENDIKKQTRKIFENIKAILEDNGTFMSSVVKVNIFLTDMNDFGIVNVQWLKRLEIINQHVVQLKLKVYQKML